MQGSLLDIELAPERFDVITMWDSLEHLHHPLASLRKAAAGLKPGGLLVLSTPTASSIDARIFGRYWIGYELPRHLTFFSNRTLEEMLGRAGFRVVDERVLHGGDFAFADEVRFLLRGWGAPRGVHEGAARLLKSRPWRWLTKPLFGLLAVTRLSTPRTFFCVKEE
jgi:SAM-dependent methyltransferase